MSNDISNERLDELIEINNHVVWANNQYTSYTQQEADTETALRELVRYRKAVREWIAAVDAHDRAYNEAGVTGEQYGDFEDARNAAEATLRALQEGV